MAEEEAPWYWKLAGLLLLATGCALPFVPRLLPGPTTAVRLVFFASGVVFAVMGFVFLKTKPAPSTFQCPSCGAATRRGRFAYYCAGCGRAMEESDEELRPFEISCPYCAEAISKKSEVCPKCSKHLPAFGVELVKGVSCCRWCHTKVAAGEKFCKYCSAPLTAV